MERHVTELELLLIEKACVGLMTAYCTHLDARDAEAFFDLFTETMVWARTHPPGLEYQGKASMRDYFNERPVERLNYHLVLNPRVAVLGPDVAEGVCMLLVIDGPANHGAIPVPMGGVSLLGEYRDVYVRTPDGWRIARRELSRLIDRKAAKS